MAKYSVMLLSVVVLLFAVLSFGVHAMPFNCTTGSNYTTGDWIITNNTYCNGKLMYLDIGGNIVVKSGYILGLEDCDVMLNASSNGTTRFNVSGTLYMNSTSTLNSGGINHSFFTSFEGSTLKIQDSTISNMGNKTGPYGFYVNGTFTITNTRFENNTFGLKLSNGASGTVSSSTFKGCYLSIVVEDSYTAVNKKVIAGNQINNSVGNSIYVLNVGQGSGANIVNITGNTIYNSQITAIDLTQSNYVNVISNFINNSLAGPLGIYLYQSNFTYIFNNTITDTLPDSAEFCIELRGSSNNYIGDTLLRHCDNGIWFEIAPFFNSYGNRVEHSSILDTTYYDTAFSCIGYGTNYFRDVTLTSAAASINYNDLGTLVLLNTTVPEGSYQLLAGNIIWQWYMDVVVKDSSNRPISAASVSDYHRNGTEFVFLAYSGTDGNINRQNVTWYNEVVSYLIPYNWHNVTASAPGYTTAKNYTWLGSSNVLVNMQLTGTGQVPEFSSILMVVVALGIVASGIVAIRKRSV